MYINYVHQTIIKNCIKYIFIFILHHLGCKLCCFLLPSHHHYKHLNFTSWRRLQLSARFLYRALPRFKWARNITMLILSSQAWQYFFSPRLNCRLICLSYETTLPNPNAYGEQTMTNDNNDKIMKINIWSYSLEHTPYEVQYGRCGIQVGYSIQPGR